MDVEVGEDVLENNITICTKQFPNDKLQIVLLYGFYNSINKKDQLLRWPFMEYH